MKKLSKLLLAIMMVLTLAMPVIAESNVVAKIGDREFTTLQEAVDAAEIEVGVPVTVDVVSDIKSDNSLKINNSVNLTINFNGHKFEVTNDDDTLEIHSSKVNLTLKDGTLLNKCKNAYGIYAYSNKKENNGFDNLRLEINSMLIETADQALGVNGLNTNQNIYVESSTIITPDSLGIYFPPVSGVLAIVDSRIEADTGVTLKGGMLIVEGNTEIIASGEYVETDEPYNGTNSLDLTGNAIYVEGGYNRDIQVEISGGNLISKKGKSVTLRHGASNNPGVQLEVNVNSGSFNTDVTEFVTEAASFMRIDGRYYAGKKDDLQNVVKDAKTDVEVIKGIDELNDVPDGVIVINNSTSDIKVNGEVVTKGEDVVAKHEVKPTPTPTPEVEPEEENPSTPTISCAGSKDKNCDGVVTCDEEKGIGWEWNNDKKVCEFKGNSNIYIVNTATK